MLPVSVPVAGIEKVAVGVGELAGCVFDGEAVSVEAGEEDAVNVISAKLPPWCVFRRFTWCIVILSPQD